MTAKFGQRIINQTEISRICAGPVIIDACILLSGCTRRLEKGFSFQDIRQSMLDASFKRIQKIIIHEAVVAELENSELQQYIQLSSNVTIVGEDNLYGSDPRYTAIFDAIALHYQFRYDRTDKNLMSCPTKNRGEIASMAYAAYHSIPFFSTSDQACFMIQKDISELNGISLFGPEVFLYLGYLENINDSDQKKRIKALYKVFCDPEIKRRVLPEKFNDYRDMIELNPVK